MSLLRSAVAASRLIQSRSLSVTAVKHHWNRDYKPGKFPVTPEERAAAAKKYNLCPEDYKPYPDDGSGLGDYPQLPLVSGDSRDDFYPWDDPALKRNFGSTFHDQEQLISEDRYDVNAKLRYSLKVQYAQLIGFLSVMFGLYYYFEDKQPFIPLAIKQYPNQPEKHYTFEVEPGTYKK